jgi:hypothetical protein
MLLSRPTTPPGSTILEGREDTGVVVELEVDSGMAEGVSVALYRKLNPIKHLRQKLVGWVEVQLSTEVEGKAGVHAICVVPKITTFKIAVKKQRWDW